MSDKLAGGIKAGSLSVSLPIELRKAADSTALTGIVFSGVTASYWRQGGARVAITTATLGSVNAAYSSGGFIEVDATNMPGVYRFDIPDAALASGMDWVVISLKVATAFQLNVMFALESAGAAEVYARVGTNGAGLTVLSTQASVNNLPTNAGLAIALASADDAVLAQVAKIKAAVFDSASISGSTITLSDGSTQTISPSGRVTAP